MPPQERRQRPATCSSGLGPVVNRDDLQVIQAESHDGVVRPPTAVATAVIVFALFPHETVLIA